MVFTVPKTLTEAHLRRVLDKEESDGRFPNAEVKNAQDQGRRYFAGLHQGSEAELVAWEARQAYIGMGFLLFAAAGMGIDSTALEGVDFPKLNEILGLDEKNLTAIAAVSLGYRSPKDGNAQRPKSRLTRDELFTSLDGECWAANQCHIALGFLLLAAAGMGVDATTLGGMHFEKVDEILGLAAKGQKSVMACALGYRSSDDWNADAPKSRFPLDAVATIL